MSTSKIIRDLRAKGFTVTVTGASHLRITHPDMSGPVFSGSSPSCGHAEKNLMAIIKRKMQT